MAVWADLLRLLGKELREVHSFGEHDIVLIELDATDTTCLVCLLPVDFEA